MLTGLQAQKRNEGSGAGAKRILSRQVGLASGAGPEGSSLSDPLWEKSLRDPLQRRPLRGAQTPAEGDVPGSAIWKAAAEGVRTPATRLPYADRIQQAFGRHEIRGVQAHVGKEATSSALAMNARAYATGDQVVFAGSPDLHTAAHEAAHVVQQQGGVQLAGGIGQAGDAYEQHADAVAGRVVAGLSAEGLLDGVGGWEERPVRGHSWNWPATRSLLMESGSGSHPLPRAPVPGVQSLIGNHPVQMRVKGSANRGTPLADIMQRAPNAGAAPSRVQRDLLPVARFSPAPGLLMDRIEKSVSISGAMELYGPEANAARATSIQNSINTTWTRTFSDGYSVACSITVTYRGPGSDAGNATQIMADRISGPSHVSPGLTGRSMTLNANDPDAFTWTAAHEFGHIIGMGDRYSEGIISKVMGMFGRMRNATAQPGYEANIMAVDKGRLESKNVEDVAKENEPDPNWINDDDQVRNWVNGHSADEIGKLSTTNKLKAIKTLMGGWISDDDVTAISLICNSVASSTEANAIRSGINVLNITSIGQRTMVRVAFAKMP